MSARLSIAATLALLALPLLTACGSDSSGPLTPGRPFNGAVSIASPDGTDKQTLVVADGYPRVTLGTVFEVIFVGSAQGGDYVVRATINPAVVGQRYELPRDAQQLEVIVQRDGAAQPVGTFSGFMQIDEADTAATYGAGVVSLSVNGVSGFALVDIDVTFDKATRP